MAIGGKIKSFFELTGLFLTEVWIWLWIGLKKNLGVVLKSKVLRRYSIVVVPAAALLAGGIYFIQTYRIVLIPKDPARQSLAEKSFLAGQTKLRINQPSPVPGGPTVDPAFRRMVLRGQAKKLSDGQFSLTTGGQEKIVLVSEAAKILPANQKLAEGQLVTVYVRVDGKNMVADRIVIRNEDSERSRSGD